MSTENKQPATAERPSELFRTLGTVTVDTGIHLATGLLLTWYAGAVLLQIFPADMQFIVEQLALIVGHPLFPTVVTTASVAWVAYLTTYRLEPGRDTPSPRDTSPHEGNVWFDTLRLTVWGAYQISVVSLAAGLALLGSVVHPIIGMAIAALYPMADHTILARDDVPTPGFVSVIGILAVTYWPVVTSAYAVLYLRTLLRLPFQWVSRETIHELFSLTMLRNTVRIDHPLLAEQLLALRFAR